jgi:hypothetical protein
MAVGMDATGAMGALGVVDAINVTGVADVKVAVAMMTMRFAEADEVL